MLVQRKRRATGHLARCYNNKTPIRPLPHNWDKWLIGWKAVVIKPVTNGGHRGTGMTCATSPEINIPWARDILETRPRARTNTLLPFSLIKPYFAEQRRVELLEKTRQTRNPSIQANDLNMFEHSNFKKKNIYLMRSWRTVYVQGLGTRCLE